MVAYSDTVFRPEVVEDMLLVDADIVFGIDGQWKDRFDARSQDDIRSAETIEIVDSEGLSAVAEFTGLLHIRGEAAQRLPALRESDVGSNLIDLVARRVPRHQQAQLSERPARTLSQLV